MSKLYASQKYAEIPVVASRFWVLDSCILGATLIEAFSPFFHHNEALATSNTFFFEDCVNLELAIVT